MCSEKRSVTELVARATLLTYGGIMSCPVCEHTTNEESLWLVRSPARTGGHYCRACSTVFVDVSTVAKNYTESCYLISRHGGPKMHHAMGRHRINTPTRWFYVRYADDHGNVSHCHGVMHQFTRAVVQYG